MFQVSNKVIIFITETMKNWIVELTTRSKTLAEEVEIQGPLHLFFTKCIRGYKFTKSQENIYHLMYNINYLQKKSLL